MYTRISPSGFHIVCVLFIQEFSVLGAIIKARTGVYYDFPAEFRNIIDPCFLVRIRRRSIISLPLFLPNLEFAFSLVDQR